MRNAYVPVRADSGRPGPRLALYDFQGRSQVFASTEGARPGETTLDLCRGNLYAFFDKNYRFLKQEFPAVVKFAVQVFKIPVASVICETSFSKHGYVKNDWRSRLDDSVAGALIDTHDVASIVDDALTSFTTLEEMTKFDIQK